MIGRMIGGRKTRREWLKGSAASAGVLLNASAAPVNSAQTGSETTLFAFDDQSIPWQHNLKLTLVPAKKHSANPVLRCGPEGSPDFGHAVIYGTVLHDGKKFRMWYLGMTQRKLERAQPPGYWRPMCYAESEDGIRWNKPSLGVFEWNGNRNNNICRIEGEPYSLTRVNDFLSVLYEPHDPNPAQRYKAAYIAHMPYDDIKGGMSKVGTKESRVGAFVCATSADGYSWKVVGDRPINAGGERFEVSGLYRFGDFYYGTGQLISPWIWRSGGTNSGRVMMAYRSPDFVNWSRAKALSFSRPGQLTNTPVSGQQTHMGAGLWNRGNVLVGLYGMWQDGPTQRPAGSSHLWGTHVDLGLILSNDGIHFREPVADFKVIARGKEGEWDSIALLQGHAFVNVGDQTMIWYSHWDTSAEFRTMETGLATLRRDGFGYLSPMAAENDGHFITQTLVSSGQPLKIEVNAENVTPESPLRLELLDHLDRPLPGFSGSNAVQITASGTQKSVTWPNSRNLRLPTGTRFAIRVHFPVRSTARVYALNVSG